MAFQSYLMAQGDIEKITELNNKSAKAIITDPVLAKEFAEQAVTLSKKINNDSLIYNSQFNRGVANYFLDKKQEALADFISNKNLAEKLNDDIRTIESLNAIGNMYKDIDRYESALQSYREGLALCESKNIPSKKLLIVSNLAMAHNYFGHLDSASYYNYMALSYYKIYKSKDRPFLMNVYGSLLGCYSEMKIEDSVLKYSKLAIEIADELGDAHTKAGNVYNTGEFYNKIGKYNLAIKFLEEADLLSKENQNLSLEFQIKQALALAYYESKNYEKAATLYKTALALFEKIQEEQTIEKLSEMEVKYETGKKEEELKRLSAEQEVSALKVKQSRTLTLISVISVLVFLIIAGVLYKQNKNKIGANKLLQKQNDEITHQKKEITDSINYAKRIQLSILPPDKMVKRLLPDAFIFYKPKDVVSGDFYWVEEKNELVMFAAVDCTGHGVPGAMMSVVGMSLLNRAVNEKDLTRPADILQHLDMGVTDTLRQNQEDDAVKDGMDLSLCTFNSKTKELQFAGAFNNLWVVRKNFSSSHTPSSDKEVLFEDSLLEVKADKFPIGSNTDGVADNYTNHKIQLQKGDYIYLYSDGFADQFGGPKGKKFKYNALKKLLVSIHDLSPAQQHEAIKKAYEDWKGNLEQIDDILVIGVRV